MMAGNLPNNERYEDKVTNGRQFLVVDHDYGVILSNWNEREKITYVVQEEQIKGAK